MEYYLDIKKKTKDEACYIDTTPFYTMDMWNGYELQRIFGIKDADLADFFSEEEKASFKGKTYRFLAMDKMQQLEPGIPTGWDFIFVARTKTTLVKMDEVAAVMKRQLEHLVK